MSYLRRIVCLMFGHRFQDGINHYLSIYMHCDRCGELVRGGRSTKRALR
jgi:hypothetical protein